MVGLSDDSHEGIPEDSLKEAIRAGLVGVNTCLPGTIISFDATKQTATVKVSLLRNLNGQLQAISNLENVPVKFQRAGGFALTFPISEGDRCEIRFSQRSLDNWSQEPGATSDPADTRIFDLSDAIADPGLYPEVTPLSGYSTTNLELRNEAGTTVFRIKPDGTFEWVNPAISATFTGAGQYKFQGLAGGDEILTILMNLCQVLEAAEVLLPGFPPLRPSTVAAIAAIRTRLTAIKAP